MHETDVVVDIMLVVLAACLTHFAAAVKEPGLWLLPSTYLPTKSVACGKTRWWYYYAFFSFTAFSFRTFSKLRLFMHDHGKKSLKAPLPDQRTDRCSFLWGMSWSDDACNVHIRTEQSQQT